MNPPKTWMWAVAITGLVAELALPAAGPDDPLADCRRRSSRPIESGDSAESAAGSVGRRVEPRSGPAVDEPAPEDPPFRSRTLVFRIAQARVRGWTVPSATLGARRPLPADAIASW